MAAALMVESVCEYIYRLRPIAEWTAQDDQHHEPKAFLILLMQYLRAFREKHRVLIAQCRPVGRLIGLQQGLATFLRTPSQVCMARHRARLYFKSRGCGPRATHHVAIAR